MLIKENLPFQFLKCVSEMEEQASTYLLSRVAKKPPKQTRKRLGQISLGICEMPSSHLTVLLGITSLWKPDPEREKQN